MKNRASIFCLVVFMLFFACDFLQRELQSPREYHIKAPELPEDWLLQSGLHLQGWLWLVDYVHTDYQSHNYSLEQKQHRGASIDISLRKQASAVVLVYPIFAESGLESWRPSGVDILWQERSADLGSYDLQATWRAGFRSFVLHRLLKGGFDIRYFNTQKLQYYLKQRIGSDAVWDYDAQYLITEIAGLKMDWYDIKKRPTTKTFGLPSGLWQALDVSRVAWPCQGSCKPELALGLHHFLELEKMQLWELKVLASGEILSILLSP